MNRLKEEFKNNDFGPKMLHLPPILPYQIFSLSNLMMKFKEKFKNNDIWPENAVFTPLYAIRNFP